MVEGIGVCYRCDRPVPADQGDWRAITLGDATYHLCPDCGVYVAFESGENVASHARAAAEAMEQAAAFMDETTAAEFRETADRLRKNAQTMESAAAHALEAKDGES
ncbi:MAG: hypothetical protein QOE67_848 [Solirubrobacteraceae bacterium]|jgi:hypothetical protein|nr:hypothetical protein [Solirubrobacteraceae bacterium]MEA2281153.1 hypothetical protein [Solirubrobacteraceae bacterium]